MVNGVSWNALNLIFIFLPSRRQLAKTSFKLVKLVILFHSGLHCGKGWFCVSGGISKSNAVFFKDDRLIWKEATKPNK